MSFEIGKTYSGYEFLDVLHMSRTEIAYRVRNTLAQRLEVLRILPRNIQDDQEQVERFLREVKVRARLVHPNIVTFYNAMEIERQLVMTTELVEGATLSERLQLGPLPWATALDYMCQALAGLSCAHSQGIVHRDVTPENMLITPEGTLKLTNFGLAKAATSPQLTQVGAVIGSLKYIAPEQIKGSAILDSRSDLYSLGVVLYETVTGKTPFESKSQFELMLAHVTETPKPPSEMNHDVPKELDRAIMKAIAKEPERRFQNADDFRSRLENLRTVLGVGGAPPAVFSQPSPTDGAATAAPLAEPPVAAAAIAPGPPAVVETPQPPEPEPVAPIPETPPAAGPLPQPPILAVPAIDLFPVTKTFEDTAAPLFGSTSAPEWGAKELLVLGVSAGAVMLLVLAAYLLIGR